MRIKRCYRILEKLRVVRGELLKKKLKLFLKMIMMLAMTTTSITTPMMTCVKDRHDVCDNGKQGRRYNQYRVLSLT